MNTLAFSAYQSRSVSGRYPAGWNQEAGLILHEWNPHNPRSSIMSTGLQIVGPVNIEAVKHSLNEIVRRHAGLRVTFAPSPGLGPLERRRLVEAYAKYGVFRPGMFEQVICSCQGISLRLIDLSHLTDSLKRSIEFTEIVNAEVARPFGLGEVPLLRPVLVTLQRDEHVLVILVDHIVSDGWSLSIIRAEFIRLYRSFSKNLPSPLCEEPPHYPLFVEWQHAMADEHYFDSPISYWRTHWAKFGSSRLSLQTLPFALEGPPRTTSSIYRSKRLQFEADTSRDILTFARANRVTCQMLFTAAYVLVLHLYTRRDGIALWCHFANRRQRGSHEIVGLLVNTHLIGFTCENDPSCLELLSSARKTILDCAKHEELPLRWLWHALNCRPLHSDANILLDVVALDPSARDLQNSDTTGDPIHVFLPDGSNARLSMLGVYVESESQRLSLRVHYHVDCFVEEGITNLLADLREVVTGMIADPSRRLSSWQTVSGRYANQTRNGPRMNDFVVQDSLDIPQGRTWP